MAVIAATKPISSCRNPVAIFHEGFRCSSSSKSAKSGFSRQATSLLSCGIHHQLGGLSLKLSNAQQWVKSVPPAAAPAAFVRNALSMGTQEGQEVTTLNGSAKQEVLQFVKYHGLGNDFLLVDNRDSETPKITPEQAIVVCDRNFGVGGDGVIFVLPGTNGSDYTMRIYNSDGSEPEMCGNGIRCMARFVAELEGTTESRSYTISTLGGLIVPRLQDDGQVCVDMGPPILEAAKIPTTLSPSKDGAVVKVPLSVNGKTWNVTCVSMGNPHCITILDDSEVLDDLPLSSIGPMFEHHEVFPARTNTEFIQVLSPSHIRMRVWERGAGATLACGTGACALVVAAILEGRAERNCLVELPGGPLQIEWREDDNHLYMTGPAQKVFVGTAFL
ncbi:unnamed protein product [Calypogeia fissa]